MPCEYARWDVYATFFSIVQVVTSTIASALLFYLQLKGLLNIAWLAIMSIAEIGAPPLIALGIYYFYTRNRWPSHVIKTRICDADERAFLRYLLFSLIVSGYVTAQELEEVGDELGIARPLIKRYMDLLKRARYIQRIPR